MESECIAPGFVERLGAALERNAQHVVVQDESGADTGSRFIDRVHWAAEWLRHAGVDTGMVVAVTSQNTRWGLALRYAAHTLGAVACHLPFIGPDRQSSLIDVIKPAIIVTDGTGPMAESAVWPVRRLAPPAELPAAPSGLLQPDYRYEPDDVCILTPSGGTTGIPKASYRTYANYSFSLSAPDQPDRRQLVVTPFAYAAAAQIDQALVGGGTVILGEHTWPVGRVIETIHAEQVTHMFVVEPALADLVAAVEHSPELGPALASLQQIGHLGAAAPRGLRERAHAILGDRVVHGYGASELGPVSSTIGHPFNAYSAGFVVPGVECRIVAADGNTAPAGQSGTITLKSVWKANGYWVAGSLRQFDEWVRTTDEGTLSADGELTIRGRSGDFLNDSGVHASDLEALVSAIAGVEYVTVAKGVDDDNSIWVVVQSSDLNVRTAIQDALEALGQGINAKIIVHKHLPRTEQGKPDRRAMTNSVS